VNADSPAGWFPDPENPEQLRYWDGSIWTEHRAPMNRPNPETIPTSPVGTGAGHGDPNDGVGAKKNWFARHKVLTGIAASLGIMVCIGTLIPDDNSDAATDRTTATTNKDSQVTSAAKPKVSQEDRFIDAVNKAADEADDADNEMKVVQLRHVRAKNIREIVPSLKVTDWNGTIDDVSTTLGGDSGVISIKLDDDIKVSTWNNGLSDISDHTLIKEDSPLYASLADLEEGDKVEFSGKFIRDAEDGIDEQSLMDINGVTSPEFTFRFKSVAKS